MFKNNHINILKGPLNSDEMKNNISKQGDRIDSQRCSNVMKTHRAKLRVDMNKKDSLIMHYAGFLHLSKYFFPYPLS